MRPLHVLPALVALTLTLTVDASAQAYLKGGIDVGVNLANVSVTPHFSDFSAGADNGIRPGLLVGGQLEWGVRDFLVAFQPEFQYVEKGTVVDYPNPTEGDPSSRNYRFSYIEFPVLARFNLVEGDLRGYAVVGPNFGFNLGATGKQVYGDSTSEVDYYEGVKRTDIGIDIGGGLEFELSPGLRLLGDLRYTHGLTDVTQPFPLRPGEETWYSRDIKFKVGLKWDLWQSSQR